MNTNRQIWGIPLLCVLLTAIGLLAALLGEGVWRWLSWAALGVPAAIGLYCAGRRQGNQKRQR